MAKQLYKDKWYKITYHMPTVTIYINTPVGYGIRGCYVAVYKTTLASDYHSIARLAIDYLYNKLSRPMPYKCAMVKSKDDYMAIVGLINKALGIDVV